MTNFTLTATLQANYEEGIGRLTEYMGEMEKLWAEHGREVLYMNAYHDLDTACNSVFSNEVALSRYSKRKDFRELGKRYSALQKRCDESSASMREVIPLKKAQDIIRGKIEQDRIKMEEDGLNPSDEQLRIFDRRSGK